MVTFLGPGLHETKQEEFDGDIKDSKKTSKNWYNTMWVGKITNALEEVLGVEWMVVAQSKSEKIMYQQVHSTYLDNY